MSDQFREQARELNAVRREQASARQRYSIARDQELRGVRGAVGRANEARRALDDLTGREREIIGAIGEASDPRLAISALNDVNPLLLFPVRLETRFKKIDDEGEGTHHELWLRIYPDDCVVDSFETL